MTEKEKVTVLGTEMEKLTIYERLCGINQDLDAIGKGSRNAQQGYAFRGIDAIADNLHPLLAKWGVICAPECLSHSLEERVTAKGTPMVQAKLWMRWHLTGLLGDTVMISVPSEALDSSDKATNKALSAGFKYALTQLFTIPFTDVAESDKETPELGSKKKKSDPVKENEKDTLDQKEAEGFMDAIGACKRPQDLPKIAQAIGDSALPEKYKASLRAVYSQKREKLSAPQQTKDEPFVEDLGDQDATS